LRQFRTTIKIFRQAFTVSLLALIVGLSINFIRSDGLPIFVSQDDELFQADQIPQISIEEAQAILKNKEVFFIDLRPINSFNKSHILGSLNFPAEDVYGMIESIHLKIPMDTKIILYGVGKEDTSPSEVASLLLMMGYSNIYTLKEGWSGWEDKVK